ncbi:MAG: class I SAM-dependent methyltransferase [Nitrospirota bacterium]
MKWDAQVYDTVKAPQVDAVRELISIANVKDSDFILDLGYGTGKLTMELSRLLLNGNVKGIDPSKEMTDKAQINLRGRNERYVI